MVTDYENIRVVKQGDRRLRRNHQWRYPHEAAVEGILGAEALNGMLEASLNLTIPVPIMCMPQVQVYRGMLVPVIAGGGFTGLGDLIAEATGGKQQMLPFSKIGVTGVANACNTLWYEGNIPSVGATAAALATGTNHTRTTAGALGQFNPASGSDTQHLVSGRGLATVVSNTLLWYDRVWAGEPAASTSGNQTVTMTPTRYAGVGANPSSAGNFAMMEIRTVLGATAHTWTMTYVDDQGNSAEAAAAVTGLNAGIAKRLDTNLSTWAFPLNANDVGISDITIINNSAVVTGATSLVFGHPLAFMSFPVINVMFPFDYINGEFNLARIFDDACIAALEVNKPTTTAATYIGSLITVSG